MFTEFLKCILSEMNKHVCVGAAEAFCSMFMSIHFISSFNRRPRNDFAHILQTMQCVALCEQFPKSIFFTQSFESQSKLNCSRVARRAAVISSLPKCCSHKIYQKYLLSLFDLIYGARKREKNTCKLFGNRLAHTHWHALASSRASH